MKVKVFRDDIIEGLHKSANIIPLKTGAAFLRTIWLKGEDQNLAILATDSNIEFHGVYPSEIIEPGLIGVQGRNFYDLMKKLPPGEISLSLDEKGQNMLIQQGKRNYKLPTNDASWFQNFSEFPEEGAIPWSGNKIQSIIDQIAYCISDEDDMEAATCISLKASDDAAKIEICGLNGHQFAMMSLEDEALYALITEGNVLIQKKYLNELKKWLTVDDVELNISEKRLFLRTSNGQENFSMPLSSYTYPDYNNFLTRLSSGDICRVQVNREELMDALDRLILFNSENNRCTYFLFNADGQLELSSQGQEVGSATEYLDVQREGEVDKIAFPTRSMIEILNHFESDTVKLIITGTEGPCGVQGEADKDYTVIIMPMKIVEEQYYSEEDA